MVGSKYYIDFLNLIYSYDPALIFDCLILNPSFFQKLLTSFRISLKPFILMCILDFV